MASGLFVAGTMTFLLGGFVTVAGLAFESKAIMGFGAFLVVVGGVGLGAALLGSVEWVSPAVVNATPTPTPLCYWVNNTNASIMVCPR